MSENIFFKFWKWIKSHFELTTDIPFKQKGEKVAAVKFNAFGNKKEKENDKNDN